MRNIFKRAHHKTKEHVKKVSGDQSKGAQRAMLEELFNDFYIERRKIYKMNFIRGLLFGTGSALGGALILAIVISLLSLFVDIPVVGNYIKNIRGTVEQSQNQKP